MVQRRKLRLSERNRLSGRTTWSAPGHPASPSQPSLTQNHHPDPQLTWPCRPAPPQAACPPSQPRQLSDTPPYALAACPGRPALHSGSGAEPAALALQAAHQRERGGDRCHVTAPFDPSPNPGLGENAANQERSGRAPTPARRLDRVRLRAGAQEGGAGSWSWRLGMQVLCVLGILGCSAALPVSPSRL